jgi:hypothetical protein
MAKNKKVMSIAIEPDLHNEVTDYCKRKGVSVSSYIGLLLAKAIKLPIDDDPLIVGRPTDEDVLPVFLKIPGKLKGNRDGLKTWMDTQTNALLNKLGGSPQ